MGYFTDMVVWGNNTLGVAKGELWHRDCAAKKPSDTGGTWDAKVKAWVD